MPEDWLLYIRTPTGNYCWPVGPPPLAEDTINAARVVAGFPAHEDWYDTDFDLSYSPGDPHPKYIEVHEPVFGSLDDLRAVKPTALRAHAVARAEWTRARNVEAVSLMLADLDEDTLAAVLAHPAVAEKAASAARQTGVA